MTSEQALTEMNKAFPGKKGYVGSMRWMHDGKADEHYTFSATVYDVGAVRGADINGNLGMSSEVSLADAVKRLIACRNSPRANQAEQMFEPQLEHSAP